ncbi:MAG: hypothetical protein FJ217_13380 [Ignavibacteria bacterium]|nr:hypothetical protein [Ignavibacteria bacterium]
MRIQPKQQPAKRLIELPIHVLGQREQPFYDERLFPAWIHNPRSFSPRRETEPDVYVDFDLVPI